MCHRKMLVLDLKLNVFDSFYHRAPTYRDEKLGSNRMTVGLDSQSSKREQCTKCHEMVPWLRDGLCSLCRMKHKGHKTAPTSSAHMVRADISAANS